MSGEKRLICLYSGAASEAEALAHAKMNCLSPRRFDAISAQRLRAPHEPKLLCCYLFA